MDEWWNFWVLLSERTAEDALVLLDPETLDQRDVRNPYIHPQRDRGGEQGRFRFLSVRGMRQGDVMFWRSTRVPHAAAVLGEPPHPPVSPQPALRRQSIDFRCACSRRVSNVVRRTRSGEACRTAWWWRGRTYFGCANPNNDLEGSWCIIKRVNSGGSGCVSVSRLGVGQDAGDPATQQVRRVGGNGGGDGGGALAVEGSGANRKTAMRAGPADRGAMLQCTPSGERFDYCVPEPAAPA